MLNPIRIRSREQARNEPMWNHLAARLALVLAFCLIEQLSAPAQVGNIGPAGSSVNQPSALKAGERVLVLRTGRVMKGRIKTISTGWLVSTDRGKAVIPFDQVQFDADDLNEAYLRLRVQSGRPTVASHLRLAEWCLSQNILPEAARELRDALEKDPANETARLMLNRVDNEIRRRTPQPQPAEQPNDVVLLNDRVAETPDDNEVRSLAGLSPNTAREFVASIQPLLLNKCGNARCHGTAAKNDFKLTRLRSGSSRIVSERNLAAVLNDLQPGPDKQTQLLKVIRGSHAGRTIFNGRYGAAQMQTLQNWMQTASKELSINLQPVQQTAFSNKPPVADSPEPDGLRNDASLSAIQVTGDTAAPTKLQAEPSPASAIGSVETSTPATAKTPTPLSNVQRLLQEARQHVRTKDAFDPEDFNRRFAGSRTQ